MIDLEGRILNTYNYNSVGMLGEGLLSFQKNPQDQYGVMDEKGNIVIQPQFFFIDAFKDGRAVVNISQDYSNKYGLINKAGTYIIKPEYNDIILLEENRVAVGRAIDKEKPFIGSIYAVGDTQGRLLTDFIYYGVSNYSGGLASAYDNKNTFFIDKGGNIVKSLPVVSGSGTLTMEGNIIKANVDYRTSYFDKEGNLIWKQNSIIPLNSQYKVIEKRYRPNKDYLVYYPEVYGMGDKGAEKKVNDQLKVLSQVKPIEEKVQLDYSYLGNFTIEFFKKNLLVLELQGYTYNFGAAHGMPTKIYPHIDLVTGRFYELKDLFKKNSNYVKVLSDIIGEQIKNDPQYSYVFPDAYKGIKADQPFYIGEDSLYIYFNPYDIAPYAAGFPTFEIKYKDIMNIIDKEGQFWQAFN